MNDKQLTWGGVLVVLCLLMLPNILQFIYGADEQGGVGGLLALPVLLWLLLLVVFWRVSYFLLIVIPFVWLMPLEAIYVSLYGRPPDIHVFGIIADTTFDEAFQFVKPYWVYLLGYIVGTTAFILYFVGRAHTAKMHAPIIVLKTTLIGVAILAFFFSAGAYLTWQQEKKLMAYGAEEELLFDNHKGTLTSMLVGAFPFGSVFRYVDYRQQVRQVRELQEKLEKFSFFAKELITEEPEVYVLIIGETTRAKNLQLNGYERDTNPLLSKRKNLISFSNMVSGWSWTRMSVPVIVTRKRTINSNIFFPEKSIVSLFSEAGFDTFWLSTQSPYGFHDSPIALSASESDFVKFLNPVDYKGSGLYDDVMLSHLDGVMAGQSNKFIVLHTLGSHYNYKDRYPEKFDVFKPSLKDEDASLQNAEKARELLNSYDNSIVFADYFIDQVIEVVSQNNNVSAVFYVSDHGEVIFDGGCDKSGHGHNTEYDHLTASMLWVSDSYRDKYEKRFNFAKDRADSPLSTEYVFHSLAGLAGLYYPEQDNTRDIFSKEWTVYPRYLQSGAYFDGSEREGECRVIVQKK